MNNLLETMLDGRSMNQGSTSQKRLYLIAALTLLLGLGSSAAIWFTAGDLADTTLVDEFRQSKVFRHELEAYGGKLSVVSSELMQWFNGLWHGRTLAWTVACISLVVSGGLFFVARYLLPDEEDHSDDDRGD